MGDTRRVDFYLLQAHVPNGRLLGACRVANSIYRRGYTILIQAEDAAQSEALDDLLWTFDQSSFVPHGPNDEGVETLDAPVSITHQAPSQHRHNVLISMLEEVPEHFDRYARIAEIVDNTEQDKALGRKRYSVYRERGCSLKTHNI